MPLLPQKACRCESSFRTRNGGALVLDEIRNRFPWLDFVWADTGYNAWQVEAAVAQVPMVRLAIVKGPDDEKDVLPRRWVLERTFFWFGRNRRLNKALLAFVPLASIQIALQCLEVYSFLSQAPRRDRDFTGMNIFKRAINAGLSPFGYEITRKWPFAEMSEADQKLIRSIEPFTMSPAGLWTTAIAVRYVLNSAIPGDVVECGVWRGGQMMMAANVMMCESEIRMIWLYDTFAGMTAPTQEDRSCLDDAVNLTSKFERNQTGEINKWCYASIDDVRSNMESTLYPKEMVRYVKGAVEKTLLDPNNLPKEISVLRLDTDWYESSKIELEVLYPRLSKSGVIILDDYGHWLGSKKATDEYFACKGVHLLLHPIDFHGRVAIKP